MADRGIPFSRDMALASWDGRKTQTRRLLREQPTDKEMESGAYRMVLWNLHVPYSVGDRLWVREPYWQWGRWMQDGVTKTGRDKWRFSPMLNPQFSPPEALQIHTSMNRAMPESPSHYARLARFMPRRYSRQTLIVTDLRVQRLQDISEDDAAAEGVESPDIERYDHDWNLCPQCGGTRLYTAIHGGTLGTMPDTDCSKCDTHKKRFQHLWDSLNAERAPWSDNPWVVAISFDRVQQNIDRLRP